MSALTSIDVLFIALTAVLCAAVIVLALIGQQRQRRLQPDDPALRHVTFRGFIIYGCMSVGLLGGYVVREAAPQSYFGLLLNSMFGPILLLAWVGAFGLVEWQMSRAGKDLLRAGDAP